jgi:hypothetical protein
VDYPANETGSIVDDSSEYASPEGELTSAENYNPSGNCGLGE